MKTSSIIILGVLALSCLSACKCNLEEDEDPKIQQELANNETADVGSKVTENDTIFLKK